MNLKPQDIFVLLKLITLGNGEWSYAKLAVDLAMSPAEVHAAIKRTLRAKLTVQYNARIRANTRNLSDFLLHGISYVFIPDRGEITKGLPTLSAAPPLLTEQLATEAPPPVWPDPKGDVRGQSFSPLYRSVPEAARNDNMLYQLLVLTDGLRGGNTREQTAAAMEMEKRLDNYRRL
ncbi:MAG: hypothetical protein SWH61_06705 [Thermodesulfobacteriota bacterium]|nr:hypothetical protein [Thermodesulfobacteriota bacterium]